jgi:hypothetical protein
VSENVEFLDVEDGTGAVDEILDCGSRGRRPGAGVLTVAAVAALLLAALAFRVNSGPRRPDAALPHPSPLRPAPTLTLPGPSPFGAGNITMVFGGGRLFALSASRLGVLDPAPVGSARRSAYIPLDPASQDTEGLVWDGDTHSVWVLPLFGRQPGILREYGADLRLRRMVQLFDVAHSAAVLDGAMYVTTNSGLMRIGRSGRPQQVPIPQHAFQHYGDFGDVHADPTRHRVLFLTYEYSAHLESWSPATGRSRVVRLSVANPTLAVVAGRIWVAGFRGARGVVERLDPRTLRPVAASPLAAELGPGAVIVDAGRSSILVRSGTDPGPLWCLDARDGRVHQRWSGPRGPVSGSGHSLFVATTRAVQPLPVNGCPG